MRRMHNFYIYQRLIIQEAPIDHELFLNIQNQNFQDILLQVNTYSKFFNKNFFVVKYFIIDFQIWELRYRIYAQWTAFKSIQ